MESLYKKIQLMPEFLKALFLVQWFSYYALMIFLMMLYVIVIYADDTTLYSNYDQASDLWQQLQLASELKFDLRGSVDWGRKRLIDFSTGKNVNWLCLTSLITLVPLIWKLNGLFFRKNHLLRCWVDFLF